jgi:hypothetical protein
VPSREELKAYRDSWVRETGQRMSLEVAEVLWDREQEARAERLSVPVEDDEEAGDGMTAVDPYEYWLETRYEEDPRDLFDEAMDEGLQWMRAQSGRG